MKLETEKSALTRELDWDNALVLNAGSFNLINTSGGTALYLDINGARHTVVANGSFSVEWTVPSDGRLSLVRTSASDAHLHPTQGEPAKLLAKPVYTGSVAMQTLRIPGSLIVNYFLKAQDGSLKATLVSPKVVTLAENATISSTSVVVYTTVPCNLLDDVTVGRECVEGDKISTDTSVPSTMEPSLTSYNALLFVPYKKG